MQIAGNVIKIRLLHYWIVFFLVRSTIEVFFKTSFTNLGILSFLTIDQSDQCQISFDKSIKSNRNRLYLLVKFCEAEVHNIMFSPQFTKRIYNLLGRLYLKRADEVPTQGSIWLKNKRAMIALISLTCANQAKAWWPIF